MPDPAPLDLITLQTAALYQFDAADRITNTNEPNPAPGPRLFLGRTNEGNIWRFGQHVSDDLAAELDGILRLEPIANDLERPVTCFDALLNILETDRPVTTIWSGPAWSIPAGVVHPPGIETTSDLDPDYVNESLPIFASDLAPTHPYAAVVADGRVVSVCSCARITRAVAEAGLRTVPAHRGRGYAAAVTAAWAAAVRATGRIPLYSTSWENTASRRVAAKIGLRPYGSDHSIS